MLKRLQRIDEIVLERIVKMHSPSRNKMMIGITFLGNVGLVWFMICLLFFILHKFRSVGVNIVIGMIITYVMGEGIIKHAVGRARPCHRFDDGEQLINKPRYYSFPSGHSAASFCVVAVVTVKCSALVWCPVLVLAVLIAFSRVYLRVHYLSDVIVGMLLGFICGLSSVALHSYLLNKFF